jgi:hypothetical protein
MFATDMLASSRTVSGLIKVYRYRELLDPETTLLEFMMRLSVI